MICRAKKIHFFIATLGLLCQPAIHADENKSDGADKKPAAAPMDQLVTLNFQDTPLSSALEHLAQSNGLTLAPYHNAMDVVNMPGETPVRLAVKDVRLQSAFNLILTPFELTWRESDGVLEIFALYEQPEELQIYPVGDLVLKDREGTARFAADELVALLQKVVDADFWEENGGVGTARVFYPATLAVRQHPSVHRRIHQTLGTLSQALRHATVEKQEGYTPPSDGIYESSDAMARIENALQRPVEFEFVDTPLVDVVAWLNDATGVNVVLDHNGLEINLLEPDTPVTMKLKGQPLNRALELILSPLELTYLVKDDVLFITDDVETGQENFIRAYPISDLLFAVPDVDEGALVESFERSLRSVVGAWHSDGGLGSMYYHAPSQCLVVSQSQPAHRDIARLFSSLRRLAAEHKLGEGGLPTTDDVQSALSQYHKRSMEEQKAQEAALSQQRAEEERKAKLELLQAQLRKTQAEAELAEEQLRQFQQQTQPPSQ